MLKTSCITVVSEFLHFKYEFVFQKVGNETVVILCLLVAQKVKLRADSF